ncbi:MAG: hypothetical protein AMXMBFR61_08360 [Fimbriimonadales bacterium]
MMYPTPVGCLNLDIPVPDPADALDLTTLDVIMQVGEKPLRFVNFPGLAWRSVFGYALRTLTCLSANDSACEQACAHPKLCLYGRIFSPPRIEEPARGFQDPPRPYVVQLPKPKHGMGQPFTRYDLRINLIGPATHAVEAVVAALRLACERGIGPDRARLSVIQDVRTSWSRPECDLDTESITLEFVTPTQLRVGGSLVTSPEFSYIVRGILRRVIPLSELYGTPLEVSADRLIAAAHDVKIDRANIAWYDIERKTRRPDKKMVLDGFAGTVRYVGDIGQFLPWLYLGSALNVGKHATFGMGHFEVHP